MKKLSALLWTLVLILMPMSLVVAADDGEDGVTSDDVVVLRQMILGTESGE